MRTPSIVELTPTAEVRHIAAARVSAVEELVAVVRGAIRPVIVVEVAGYYAVAEHLMIVLNVYPGVKALHLYPVQQPVR